jgi:predicted DCC family thiol-disulfide oxidoreductase YuxK
MTSWFARHPRPIAWQSTDLAALGLTEEECKAAVQFVDGGGRISSGAAAAARVLIVAGFPYSIVGRIMLLPGIRAVASAAYRWVANNRHRFKGDPA